jgi:hypothetical protein
MAGDVRIDVEAVRRHALETAPSTLSPAGDVEKIRIDEDEYEIVWLAQERFDRDLSRWAVEGDSEFVVVDGKLRIRKLDPERRTTGTVWFRPELPQNVLVRFHAKPTEPAEGNAANLNLFLHACEKDGSALKFGRGGSYQLYHEIPNYIFTLTGGIRSGWSRARRDPGFQLLHEADVRSDVGTQYEIVVTCVDGRLRYYLNGRKLHDVVDPEPLPGGRFGLRTWSTNGWWDDVEFGGIAIGER